MADVAIIRSIGGFTAKVTVEERARDTLTVTRNPVERGAAITDHAYKNPADLTLRAGWSNSDEEGGGDPNYVIAIYAKLLALQNSRQPFTVVTGKRTYQNMLMSELEQVTNGQTENALVVTAQLTEVILVDTQVIAISSAANQTEPQTTAGVTPRGTQQLQPRTDRNF